MTPEAIPSWAVRVAALVGGLGVALGAFGAHGLEQRLIDLHTTETYHTAVLYHLLHAVVLLVLAGRTPFARGVYLMFLAGIIIFSGSLYVLAVTGQRWLGAVTPFGGVAFLAGWFWLVFRPKNDNP